MGRKGVKIPSETKLKIARLCFEKTTSILAASKQYGIDRNSILEWVYRYREQGELAFLVTGTNNIYSAELKLQAVLSYLNG